MMNSLVAVPGGWELVLIVLVILLLFGAKKLPELARGSGRALRIFKAETKGLVDDDDDVDESQKTPEEREIEARGTQPQPPLTDTDDPAHPVVRDQRDGQAS